MSHLSLLNKPDLASSPRQRHTSIAKRCKVVVMAGRGRHTTIAERVVRMLLQESPPTDGGSTQKSTRRSQQAHAPVLSGDPAGTTPGSHNHVLLAVREVPPPLVTNCRQLAPAQLQGCIPRL